MLPNFILGANGVPYLQNELKNDFFWFLMWG